jgi:SAM-dependent methyltransferase
MEIGCGEGFFLEQAKKRNWEVYGTELSPNAIEICSKKQLNVKSSIEDFRFEKSEMFDVVLSIEVIEHLPFPLKEAASYQQLLRKGGALYMTTPNFNSISRRVLGEKWSIILYPEHLIYYTPLTITRLLEKFGFKKVSIRTEGISPARFIYTYKKSNASQSDEAQKYNFNEVDRNLRKKIEHNKLLSFTKSAINFLLRKTSAGDSMKVLFEKI